MALTDENTGIGATMLVSPTNGVPYYGGMMNNCGLFGGGDSWLGILFLIALCNGGFGFGGLGGYGMGMLGMDGFGLYPWLNNSQNMNDGFRSQALNTSVSGIQNAVTSGFGDVQTALCGGFAGVNATVNGAQNAISQQLYTNQLADLERSFAAQTASMQNMNALQSQLANCCCENRLGIANLGADIARENCADRAAVSDGIRDILVNQTANTQRILDQMCNDKIDAKNEKIADLERQLTMANLAASQVEQTAQIRASQATTANQLVNELRSCPIPSQPVYGNQPIFTCPSNNSGCGCGCGSF